MRDKRSLKRGMKYWLRLLSVGIIGGILLVIIAIEIIFVIAITKPAPSIIGDTPQRTNGREYQPVSLINEGEDIHLSGWYLPSENGAAIILLHGYGSNRLEMKSRADILVRHGYGVLLYDLRGHGESGGDERSFGWQDVEDVKTALEFLSECDGVDPDRIGIVGFSIGGQIALRAAAEFDQIQAIIADDPGYVTVDDIPIPAKLSEQIIYLVTWINGRLISLWTGIPIPAGVPEVIKDISPRPILFIDTGHAGGRAVVRHFYEIADEPKDLWEIPETYHGGQLKARPLEYAEKMISFFEKALLNK